MADDYDPRIQEAIEFLKFANDADTMNRQEGLEDLKFGGGDQWPVELQNSRNLESRPCITVNKVDNYYTKCRVFLDTDWTGTDIRTRNGVICKLENDLWIVVDKF